MSWLMRLRVWAKIPPLSIYWGMNRFWANTGTVATHFWFQRAMNLHS